MGLSGHDGEQEDEESANDETIHCSRKDRKYVRMSIWLISIFKGLVEVTVPTSWIVWRNLLKGRILDIGVGHPTSPVDPQGEEYGAGGNQRGHTCSLWCACSTSSTRHSCSQKIWKC